MLSITNLRQSHLLRSFFFTIITYTLVSLAVYVGTFTNQFAIVDDLQGIVENQEIRNWSTSMKSLILGRMIATTLIAFFGITPLPFYIVILTMHIIAASLIYLILRNHFGVRTAFFTSLLFLVHPVNTEAINWISAHPYVYAATLIYLLIYIQNLFFTSKKNRYLWLLGGCYLFFIVFFRSAWVVTVPFILFIYDRFVQHKTYHSSVTGKIQLVLAACIPIFFALLPMIMKHRMTSEALTKGLSGINQQQLLPIVEGYPYSIYKIISLYIAPVTLSIYDDGVYISLIAKIIFFTCFFSYIGLLIFFARKNYTVFGLLLLLPVCVAPVFSPVKLTWYMAERYLYLGTPFFCLLCILFFKWIREKTHTPSLFFILTFITFFLFTARTILRNRDWQTPETFAYATIASSPLSIRPYNDLAGYYYLQGDVEKAKKGYKKTLTVGSSLVAMNNLGLIYMRHGLDPHLNALDISAQNALQMASQMQQANEWRLVLFYLNEAYEKEPKNIHVLLQTVYAYIQTEQLHHAHILLKSAEALYPDEPDVWFLRGYLAYRQGDLQLARDLLTKVIKRNPSHQTAKDNLMFIEDRLKTDKK